MERITRQKSTGKRSIAVWLLLMAYCFYAPFLSAQNPAKSNLNIVFIGNSITHGAGLKDFKTMAPPVFAVDFLKQQAQTGEVNFSNQGISGFTTVDFSPGTRSFNQVEQAARGFENTNAQLVFSIDLGTNDSAVKGPNGAPVSPENYYQNLKAIADQLLLDFPKCKIILHRPLWYSPNTYNRSQYLAEGLKRLQSYFPEIHSLVKSYAKTNPKQVFLGDKKGFNQFKKRHEQLMQHENGQQGIFYLHPNEQGAQKLGVLWGKAIAKVVEK
ncbi:MAG: GDSL-type esterase/lipase family protein [Mucilaginibacter sp.]|uniref:GDSL-type esterase/lipase family protein n=1 Tax=Mucilaginibacter sp. TaxID=1882438 RepID=UPI0034E57F97